MKKLVAMVLALCLLMACVPAFATLTLPETMADVPGAVKPVMPAYTLTEAGDHYEVVIDGVSTDQPISCWIYGYDGYDDYEELYLHWNAEGTALESNGLLGEAFSVCELAFDIYKPDGSGYNFYSVDLETGNLISVSDGNWSEDGDSWYSWYEEDNRFTYQYTTPDGGYVDVTYNSVNGNVRNYTICDGSGMSISYNRYGQITGGYAPTDEGDYYWDSYSKQWYNGETGEPNDELPALTLDEYPALYAEPYILYKPSANLKDLDTTEGSLYETEDGRVYYWSENLDAVYDENGKLVSYSYGNLEGTKSVCYDANDVLLNATIRMPDGTYYSYDNENGWFYDNGDEWIEIDESDLPEDVTVDDMEPLKDPVPVASKVKYTWYDHNTVGLVGLSLRDMGITDKWYNVVPVDLTQDGVQVFDLVGSNLFHIGKAAVIVQDGKVSVDYDLFFGHGYVKDECVQWFTSLDDITTDFLNNPTSDLAFGQELSIADDLGGAETAILFICNRVTYRQPYNGDTGYLSRYWPNRQRWIDYRAELTELLEGMSK